MLQTQTFQGKILVVDDKPQNLHVLFTLLTKQGYEVRPVLNAEQALSNAWGTNPPDLILLDIMMPEINGFEVCENLKTDVRSKDIPILFISALGNVNEKLKAFSAGGIDYITKPFQEQELLARVDTQMTLRRQQKDLEKKNKQLEAEIARRKQTEEELRKAKNKAEIANKAKSNFLSNISHEFRTPLNSIIGFASIIRKDNLLSEPYREFGQIIESSGKSLLSLINELLDLGKIEAGKLDLVQTNIDLLRLIKNVIKILKIHAEEQGISLILDAADNLPPFVNGDPNRLNQILINIVSNAIKFTKKGSVILRVGCTTPDQSLEDKFIPIVLPINTDGRYNQWIRFEIIDTGIGIDLENFDTIFKPFEQAGDQKYSIQGTGLGLTISRSIIQLMNGSFQIRSKLGEGSTFRIDLYLPVTQNKNEFTSTDKSEISKHRRIISYEGPKRTVLVADDTPANCQFLQLILEAQNFNVIVAKNGEEAFAFAKENSPDIILMDLVMPDINGSEAAKKIRLIHSLNQIPIIAVSASIHKKNFHKINQLGFNDFLIKPIFQKDLNLCLKKYLKLKWIYQNS
ncbi:signal transduction histidine kinase [Candidatus Magnetomorum sp. HK-1]|nr:signal transduction histidine kinase [Candidatus Magnetomorum sp. HK-1]